MPELPEVQTTVNGLQTVLPGLTITDVWGDLHTTPSKARRHIKDAKYFTAFRRNTIGKKITEVSRAGKHVMIHLDDESRILIHMKMTGHVMYGAYTHKGSTWTATHPGPLQDPFNQWIHLVCTLSDGNQLVLSDMRKFAKVLHIPKDEYGTHSDIVIIGPDPLTLTSGDALCTRLMRRPRTPIKQAFLDQTLISGIGNIYSDEILFAVGIHPHTHVEKIPKKLWGEILKTTKKILTESIGMGGDSMSDYRNAFGEKGLFQNSHKAYRRTKLPCLKKGCTGTIERLVIGGRSSHFCNAHQIQY